MKNFKHWLATMAVLLCSLTANAHDFVAGDIYYNITSSSDLTVAVTYRGNSYDQYPDEYSGAIIIPSTATYNSKTYSVTSIGDYAFSGCSSLTSITIPESVTSIEENAFIGCKNLYKVINYSNLSLSAGSSYHGYIAYYAKMVIKGSELTTVGDFQFRTSNGTHYLIDYVGSNIESITLPDKCNGENYIVDSYALYRFAFKSVTVGSGVLEFNTDVYSTRPTKVIWLTNTPPTSWENGSGVVNYSSNGEISSSDNTFPYLSSMFEVDGVKYVMLSPKERTCVAIDCAYNNTAENIVIGKTVTNKNISFTVTEVKPYAFYKNNYITEVSVEHNGNIGECAFLGCQSIQKIKVANQGSIGREAFLGCTAKTINVSNHGAIADFAFYQCSGMESISISNKGVIGTSAFAMSKGEETNVTISNAGNIGQAAFYGFAGIKSVNISNAGEVGQGAFKDCIDLQTVKVENIGRVESEAFYNCSSLAVASLGEDVSALGDYAFNGCTTLSNIVIPNTVQKVGAYCFYGCSAMENAFIGTGVTKTENYTFAECTNLKHIEIGKNVIEIGKNAFYDCKSLLEVNLPEGTKTIKESAFENCEAIAEINIPQATETIDKNVFKGCKNLSDVIIKDRTTALNLSYNSGTSSTNNPLFRDCSLDSVYIGGKIVYSTTKANGYSPFYNNKTLRTVVIANGEDNIYEYEFAYCSNLQHISIGNDVTAIGTYAFAGCTSLPTITIPSSTTKINDYAFYKCSKLADVIIADRTGTIYLGHNGASPMFVDCPLDSVYIGGKITYSTVETNGYSPFYRNTSLRTVHVTHNEVTIYENEFYGCTGLKSVSIGNGVTSIGDYAFSGCSALISFSFGKSMETIGKEAFSDCTSMVDLTSCATVPPTCGNQALADINVWDCILHVPSGCADAYYDADQWDGFFFIEEDGIQTEYYTLTYMVDGKVYKAETYAAGATVTMLVPTKEGYVFSGWNNVITTMPNENVIVTGTFVQKEMVTQVVVTITLSQTTATLTEGETMTLTATIAPEDATDKSITWSSSNTTVATVDANGKVTAIATGTATITAAANDGSGVTAACEVTVLAYDFEVDGIYYNITSSTDLTVAVTFKGDSYDEYSGSITIPATVTYEGVNYSVTSIGYEAFCNCSLTSINIPEGVTSIGGSAFSGCSSLTAITIPEGVTSIDNSAFYGCSSLTSITVAEGNAKYDSRGGCNAIIETNSNTLIAGCSTTIIPESVTSIGSSAFFGCRSLTAITIPESVTSIGDFAFYGCSSLTAITIPEGVTSIGVCAFQYCSSLTAITIPESVTSIGNYAFDGCRSLTAITCEAEIPPTINDESFRNVRKDIPIYVPAGSVEAYQSEQYWSEFTNFVGIKHYNINYVVDGNDFYTLSAKQNSSVSILHIDERDGYTFSGWKGKFNLCLKDNAHAMLYTNAPCTSTLYGDQFVGWHVLFDGDANTIFHTEYSNKESADGLDHYLRVDMGEGNSIEEFTFTYTVRAKTCPYTPTKIVVEGSDEANGEYEEIAVLTDLPLEESAVYESALLCNGKAYRYIRYRVTETDYNDKVYGHSYFYFAEFDMTGSVNINADDNAFVMPGADVEFNGTYHPRTIKIIDTEETFNNTKEDVFKSITYIRNFKNTNWQALYVPFEIPFENIKDDFVVAYINDVHQFDDDDDGTIDRTQVEAIKFTNGVLKANYPYMIRAKVAGEKSITVTDATLYAAEDNSIDCSSVFDTYTFTGTYSKIPAAELPKEEGYYALSGGAWKNIAAGTSLGAFRMYMKIDSRDASASVQARAIEMRVIGDDGVTAIENVGFNTPETRTATFDMQGRRMENPTKGLYIIDGKKVWIK